MKPSSLPKSMITGRLWLGFGLLIFVIVLTLIIYFWQVQRINSGVAQTVEVQEPLERAVLQMQFNVDTTAQAVSYYVRNREPAEANKVRDSEVEFGKLTVEFSGLAQTNEVNLLGQEITRLYEEFRRSVDETIALVDKRYAVLLLFIEDREELSDMIDRMLQVSVEETSFDTVKKLKAAIGMQDSLDKTAVAVSSYILRPNPNLPDEVLKAQEDFEQAWTTYQETNLSIFGDNWLYHINQEFEETAIAGNEIIQITDNLNESMGKFEQSYSTLDTYLGDEVQPLLHALAVESSEDLHATAASASKWLILLGVLGFLIGGISVLIISKNITNPIRQLAEGAATVNSGRLEHRFNIDAKGEFGRLALALNQMLDGLGRSRDALGESEELAWTLLDATNDACVLTDRRGVILASNEVAAARFGLSLEQMIDESIYDLLPAGPAASMRTHIEEAIRSGKPVHYEEEREGKIIDQDLYPVLSSKGEISRIAIFARDITVRKWVEDVSEQLGRRNELILKAAGEGIYGLDTQGKSTFVNPAAARMLGYDPENLIGQRHHELVHHTRSDGRPYPNEECPVHASFKDGTVHTNVDDEVFWRRDGTSFPVEYTSTPIIEDGRILGAVVTFRDITDRKRLEKILHQSEEKYRSVVESAASLIIWLDQKGTVTDCSPRIERLLGYTPDEVIGQTFVDFVQDDDRLGIEETLDVTAKEGFQHDHHFRMILKQGGSVEVSMNTAITGDINSEYARTVCMISTVSKRVYNGNRK